MRFFLSYLKQRRTGLFVFFLFSTIFLCVFLLYHLPIGAVLYPTGLCVLIGICFLLYDMQKAYHKHQCLSRLQKLSASVMEGFPQCDTIDDADYQQIIHILREEQRKIENQMNIRYTEMIDYYTVWAHQIKTPIASMRLNLQNEDTAFSRMVSEDLFRIEQYVEMVLCYLRLDSSSTDYLIREYDLDSIVKQSIKNLLRSLFGEKSIFITIQSIHWCSQTKNGFCLYWNRYYRML